MKEKIIAKNKEELREIIRNEISQNDNSCSLNHVDVSLIKNMDHLFCYTTNIDNNLSDFNGDISKWDVSNVESMDGLFSSSEFNNDISQWNVSNVQDMCSMFSSSKFNRDISLWDTSNVKNMYYMFYESEFDGDISKWNVSKVKNMEHMFFRSQFNRDITNWKPLNLEYKLEIFKNCSSPVPYWAEAENIPAAVRSYWLNKELESSLIDKIVKNNKMKI